MGRQINFFMMPDDIRELDGQIRKMGLKIIEYKMPTQEIVQLQSLLEGKRFKKLIIYSEYLKQLNIRYYEQPQIYCIDCHSAPAIEFNRPYFDTQKKIMKTGRLYYETEFLNNKKEFERKPEKLIKTGEKLYRWFRNHFENQKINSWFTTARTKEWINNERGTLLTTYNKPAS